MLQGDTSWWGWLFAVVLDNSVEFVALALLAGGLHLLLRRADPRIRHAIWLMALISLILPVDPPLPWDTADESAANPYVGRMITEWRELGSPPIPGQIFEAPWPRTGRSSADQASPTNDSMVGGVDRVPSVSEQGRSAESGSRRPESLRGVSAIGAAWAAGTLLLLGLISVRAFLTRRIVRRARPEDGLSRLARDLGDRFGLKSEVPVLCLGGKNEPDDDGVLAGPALVGLLRPRILVPGSAIAGWSPEELQSAVAHELAHVARRDQWTSLFQRLLTSVFFFHPLVWWAGRRLATERELCCDDMVMAHSETPKAYLRAMLKSSSPRRTVATPVLGVSGEGSHIGRRVRRLSDAGYRIRARRPLAAILAMVMVVALFGVLVAGTPGSGAPDADGDRPRVTGYFTYPSYYAVGADGAVELDRPMPANGDLQISRRRESLGINSLDIPAELSGELRIELVLGPTGELLRSAVQLPLAPAFDRQVLELLRAATWEPSRHKERGPIALEVIAHLRVEPADLTEGLRPTMGEVAEALPFDWSSDGTGPRAPAPYPPAYLPLRERPDFVDTVREDWVAEDLDGDYSLVLEILEDGRVGEVQSISNTRTEGADIAEAERIGEFEARLRSWVAEFRFDPPIDGHGVRNRRGALMDVRVEGGVVRVATYGPVAETWRTSLEPLYRLEEGQALKLIPRSETEGLQAARLEMYRAFDVRRGRGRTQPPSVMHFEWNRGRLTNHLRSACYGGCSLFDSEGLRVNGELGNAVGGSTLAFERFELIGLAGRTFEIGPGDVIWRLGATREELLSGLVHELSRILDVPARWETGTVMRRAIVLRGQLGEIAGEPGLRGRPTLHVYRDEKEPDPRSGSGFADAIDGASLAGALETFLRMPVVDETVGAPVERFTVRMHRSAWTEAMEEVAANIASQSGLEVFLADRAVDTVRIVLGDA